MSTNRQREKQEELPLFPVLRHIDRFSDPVRESVIELMAKLFTDWFNNENSKNHQKGDIDE
jgi:hypothetical protein